MQPTYNPEIFSVRDIGEARAIILTAESSSTDDRWERETPMMRGLIETHATVGSDTVVLDYGCGIGRMAKALIDRHGCRVIGVDISPSMRSLSVQYVSSDLFFACSPQMLELLIDQGLRFDLAMSVWVLQHCPAPARDIKAIRDGLRPGGSLFVVNNVYRAVPSREHGWISDGIDIDATLRKVFDFKAGETLHSPDVPSSLSGITYWSMLEKR